MPEEPTGNLYWFFLQDTIPVSRHQLFQILDPRRQLFSQIGIAYHDTLLGLLHDGYLRRILLAWTEWHMLRQCQMVGIEDQGISGDTSLALISLGQSAVNDK